MEAMNLFSPRRATLLIDELEIGHDPYRFFVMIVVKSIQNK
jgi:hypothetical protein